jgi:iron complex transport system substrate-binding protein
MTPLRIASLLASGTEIVCALGLADRLVGISHECDYPPDVLDKPRLSRPRFDPAGLTSGAIDAAVRQAMRRHGSVYAVDTEALARVRPDLILTQAVCAVCAVPAASAQEAAAALDYAPTILSLDAHDLAGIFRSILDVGRAAGIGERARDRVAALERRVERVRARVADRRRPTVLALEWLDPPFVPGHWVPGMVDAAGGKLLFGRPGERSDEAEWSDLAGSDPDVLVVMPCGFGLEAARVDAAQHAEQLRVVAKRALASGRAYVVDASSYFNRSGPRVVDGIEILAALLHRDVFPEVALAGRAERIATAFDTK